MAEQRNIIHENLVNPAMMPGIQYYAGRIDIDSGNTATFEISAKSVLCTMGQIGTTTVEGVPTKSTTKADTWTIVYTAAATGVLNYGILATSQEEIEDLDAGTSNITIESAR